MNPGTTLGPYAVTARIGAGGMGEVWRARDERLGRDVAIKILPAELTRDGDRLKRFEQEARAAGSLNHPNLITIFDSGTHEGMPYIAMELLEGETLRDKLGDGGRIAPRKAIDYSIQIATGLAAAHDKGIVHRDLKPENLFVCRDGRVKILDFGLAKLTSTNSNPDAPTQKMATAPGAVMGTVAYMSPEQVRGQNVDHRTDIFSFGVILFEMIAGRRPFEGATAADLMSAILHHDPPEVELPPSLNGIVRHCLEKSPDERFQSVRDLAFHLQTVTGSSPTAKVAPIESKPARRIPLIAGAALAIVLASAMTVAHHAGYRWTKPRPAISGASQLTFLSGTELSPSIAPDGKTFVFDSSVSGNADIYLQRVDGRNAINLTKDSPDDDFGPAFSPDGSQIVFHSDRGGGGLYVMGATGEAVRRIADFGYNAAWSPDGTKVVCGTESIEFNPRGRGTNSALWIIDVSSGAKRLLTDKARPVQPNWSPHGDRIVYWTVDPHSQRDLYTIDPNVPNAAPVPLTHDAPLDWNPIWSSDGRYVYFGSDRGGTMGVWRIAVDERSGRPQGEPEMMTVPARFAGHFSIDRTGNQLLFASFESFDSIRRASLVTGETTTVAGGTMPMFAFGLSRDGQSIAYTTSDRAEELFVTKSDGSDPRQITDSPDRKRAPSWTPDGRILFYANRSGSMQAWRINADGSGLTQVTDLNVSVWYPSMSPDGKWIVASNEKSAMIFPSSPLPARSATFLPPPPDGPEYHFAPDTWSPDSRYIAGGVIRTADEFPLPRTLLYDTVRRTYEVLSTTAVEASWMPDGKSLLVIDHKKVKKLDIATRAIGNLPVPIELSLERQVAVSPDAKYVYWEDRRAEADIWRVTMAEP
jgi:eukaryotic-like serine/threonine-protein kinase